jgi:hypothetical protein
MPVHNGFIHARSILHINIQNREFSIRDPLLSRPFWKRAFIEEIKILKNITQIITSKPDCNVVELHHFTLIFTFKHKYSTIAEAGLVQYPPELGIRGVGLGISLLLQ